METWVPVIGTGGDAMQLEDYFDFLASNDIRIKGSRIGIETILLDYIDLGLSAEEIALRYRTLTLEQVYATLAYYWHYRNQTDTYLQAAREHEERMIAEQERNPPPAVRRLQEMVQKRYAASEPTPAQ
jgi:uncharacterized protein (DUF433 family)